MRIAIGKKQASGSYLFQVAIPFLNAISIEISKVTEKSKDNAPDWNITHHGERCGALWRREPRGGGESFLSGQIESPVFPGDRLDIAIFLARDETRKGEMDMVWSPSRDRQASTSPQQSAASAPGSTAPPADDDDIPF